ESQIQTVATEIESAAPQIESVAPKLESAAPQVEATGARLASAPVHHIATDKNLVSAARGGPWTPRFEALFKRAGMSLQDLENKVAVPGHRGPHPQAYHEAVFKRLSAATEGLSGEAYTSAFKAELGVIKEEVATAGSELNKLLTR